MSLTRPSQRQIDKEKSKLVKDQHFLVKWCDGEDLCDVLSSKDILLANESDILHIIPGTKCKAKFKGNEYDVEILASGKYADMKIEQEKREISTDEEFDDAYVDDIPATKPLSKKKTPKVKKTPIKKKTSPIKGDSKHPAKKRVKAATDDKAKIDENNRISKIILSEALSFNNTYSPSASTNVYDASSPIIPVAENVTTDISIIETQNENLGSTCSEDVSHEPYKIMPLPQQLIQSPNWIIPQQSDKFAPWTSSSCHPQWPFDYHRLPVPEFHQQSQFVDMHSEMYQLRKLVCEGLTGMSSQLSALKSDVDYVRKKIEKRRLKKEKDDYSRKFRSDSEETSELEHCMNISGSSIGSPTALDSSSGCVFGNPFGGIDQRIWLPKPSQREVAATVAVSKDATKLAIKLLSLLFTKEELSNGICTTGCDSDRSLLDQNRIEGIRLHINYIYPLSNAEAERERWHKLLHGNLNSKCRNAKNNAKKTLHS